MGMILNKKNILFITIVILFLLTAAVVYFFFFTLHVKGTVVVLEKRNVNIDQPVLIEKKHVKKGQLVNRDTRLITFNLYKLNAEIEEKKYQIIETENKLLEEGGEITKLENELELERNNLLISEKKLIRLNKSYEIGTISLNELEGLKEKINSNRIRINELNNQINTKLDKMNNGKLLKQKLKNLNVELSAFDDIFKYYNIQNNVLYAPFDNCVVEDINCDEGDIITEPKMILSLLNLDTLVIEAKVPEDKIKYVKVGAKAMVKPAYNVFKKIPGKVTEISNAVYKLDFSTYFLVEIEVSDKSAFYTNNNVDVIIYRK